MLCHHGNTHAFTVVRYWMLILLSTCFSFFISVNIYCLVAWLDIVRFLLTSNKLVSIHFTISCYWLSPAMDNWQPTGQIQLMIWFMKRNLRLTFHNHTFTTEPTMYLVFIGKLHKFTVVCTRLYVFTVLHTLY